MKKSIVYPGIIIVVVIVVLLAVLIPRWVGGKYGEVRGEAVDALSGDPVWKIRIVVGGKSVLKYRYPTKTYYLTDIEPGSYWKEVVRKAIQQGDFFIACFSKAYGSRRRTHMNQELDLAVEELGDYSTDQVWFIPVLLEECDVPARPIGGRKTLLDIEWVALYQDWGAGIQRILDVIQPIPIEVQRLIDALRSDDDEVRNAAIKALYRSDNRGTIRALIKALIDKDAVVRENAAYLLQQIGDNTATPALAEALKDENDSVRVNAAHALQQVWVIQLYPLS